MTQNTARIITAATIATGTASAYRDRTAIAHFAAEHGVDFDAMTTNAKSPKPRYEVRETQLEGRNFEMTLVERSNSNQTKFGPSIKVGIYGGRLDKPVKTETPAVEAAAQDELADA